MTLLLFFFLSVAHAQVFEGPVSAGLGGSGRAGLDANEGVFLNPALVSLLPKSELSGYYKDGDADVGEHRQAWGVSVSENQEDELFPGQLSYIRTRNTGLTHDPANGELFFGSIGRLFDKRFGIGISVYRLTEQTAPTGALEQWNGAIGGVFLILPELGVAYVFENPANASSLVPVALRLMPQQSVGAYYSSPYYARFRLDFLRREQFNPGQRINVHGSVESEFADYFLFRLGARWDELEDQRFVTAGLCFNGPKLKIDYGVEKNIDRTGGAVHSVDIRTTF